MKIYMKKMDRYLISLLSSNQRKIPEKKIYGKVLILKCCNSEQFYRTVSFFRKNSVQIYSLGFRRMSEEFRRLNLNPIFFGEDTETFYYDPDIIEEVNNIGFHTIIIPVNNPDKAGYEDISRLISEINGKKIWLTSELEILRKNHNIFLRFLLSMTSLLLFPMYIIIKRFKR